MSAPHLGECPVCSSTRFSVENGLYFCDECNTALEDAQQLVDDSMFFKDTVVEDEFLHQSVAATPHLADKLQRKVKARSCFKDVIVKHTSWEVYSCILKGWVDQLISLGVKPDLKVVTLQLWTKYLNLHKIAFFSTEKAEMPRLGLKCNKNDANLIYEVKHIRRDLFGQVRKDFSPRDNKEAEGKKINKNQTRIGARNEYLRDLRALVKGEQEKVIAQVEQMDCTLDNLGTKKKKEKPIVKFNPVAKKILDSAINSNKKIDKRITDTVVPLNGSSLIALLRVALILIQEDVLLSDLFRLSEDHALSLTNPGAMLPSEMVASSDPFLFREFKSIAIKPVNALTKSLLKMFDIHYRPNFDQLVSRYCKELQLPVFVYEWTADFLQTRRNLSCKKEGDRFEILVMAHIILVIKLLFSLNDKTEWKLSEFASVINKEIKRQNLKEPLLFEWDEWRKYITCRNAVVSLHHYPTFLNLYKRDRVDPDLVLTQWQRQYLPKQHEGSRIIEYAVSILRELDPSLKTDNDGFLELHSVNLRPSLTPLSNYLDQLVTEYADKIPAPVLPTLTKNFTATSVLHLVDNDYVQQLSEKLGIKISIIDRMEENLTREKIDDLQKLDNFFCSQVGEDHTNERFGRFFVPAKRRVKDDNSLNLPPAAFQLLKKRLKSCDIEEELIPPQKMKRANTEDDELLKKIKAQSRVCGVYVIEDGSIPRTIPEGFRLKAKKSLAPEDKKLFQSEDGRKEEGKSRRRTKANKRKTKKAPKKQGTNREESLLNEFWDKLKQSTIALRGIEKEKIGDSRNSPRKLVNAKEGELFQPCDIVVEAKASRGNKKKKRKVEVQNDSESEAFKQTASSCRPGNKAEKSQTERIHNDKGSVTPLILNRMHRHYWIADYRPWARRKFSDNAFDFDQRVLADLFPSSFVWLMRQCALIVHCEELDLYKEFVLAEEAMLNQVEKLDLESSDSVSSS